MRNGFLTILARRLSAENPPQPETSVLQRQEGPPRGRASMPNEGWLVHRYREGSGRGVMCGIVARTGHRERVGP